MQSDTPETDRLHAEYLKSDKTETEWMDLLWDQIRKSERERNDLRRQLREEQALHVISLDERDEARKLLEAESRDSKKIFEKMEQAIRERDEARAIISNLRAIVTTDHEDKSSLTRRIIAVLNP